MEKKFKVSYPIPNEVLNSILLIAKHVRPNKIEVIIKWKEE